jgi:hypothetical protein
MDTLPLLDGTAKTRLPGAKLTSLMVDRDDLVTWRDESQRWGFADRVFVYACDEPTVDFSVIDPLSHDA